MSTTETMTIHRALVELKTIDKRIGQAIGEANFCMSAKMNAKKLLGQPTEEFTAKAVSAYDKINELIHRRTEMRYKNLCVYPAWRFHPRLPIRRCCIGSAAG